MAKKPKKAAPAMVAAPQPSITKEVKGPESQPAIAAQAPDSLPDYPQAYRMPFRFQAHGAHATPDGYPSGAVIHYTADGPGVEGTIESLVRDGYGYHFIIARDGKVYQCAPLNARLYHAGHVTAELGHNPIWVDQHNAAREFCGIALDNWGYLKERGGNFYAWPNDWKKLIPAELVRKGPPYKSPGQVLAWEAATPEQVAALTDLCLWLVKIRGLAPGNFCGHDEIRRGKSDPGGSLPFTMARFREVLAETSGIANVAANHSHPGVCA
jgi:N-acetyl-anhydromuramyl-L-alanine amidase AmpD